MTDIPQRDSADEVNEQAVAWVVRLNNEPSRVDLERFEQWRRQSDRHEQALADALAAWLSIDEHATAPKLLAMRRDALERARRTQRRWGPWDWRAIAAVVALVVLTPVIAVSWYKLQQSAEQLFHTGLGEQRVMVLPDGSRMSLDALTEVRVRYTPDVRSMELISGRANFEVAKDVTRPLKVRAGPRTVTAVGTLFTVEREPGNVVVTLLEGAVAVTSRDLPNSLVEMQPRQELRMTDSGEVAASWDFVALMRMWTTKHARTAFVPYLSRKEPQQYAYGHTIYLAEGADILRFLRLLALGHIAYDPGIWTLHGKAGRSRSQFRIGGRHVAELYGSIRAVVLGTA